jgi:Mg-chelatase subunit ChlD
MESAVAAAHLFVDAIGLSGSPDGDRVAVVGFNRTGWIQQPLTADRALVGAALEGLAARMQEHTRLDLALSYGGAALEGTGPGRERIVVLLTDGLPNQVPYAEDGTMDTTILRQAQAVKSAGATVYTIGLGRSEGANPEVNAALLARVASRPDTAYLAPDALDLGRIYQQIAVVIPCGAGPYWPNR